MTPWLPATKKSSALGAPDGRIIHVLQVGGDVQPAVAGRLQDRALLAHGEDLVAVGRPDARSASGCGPG